MRGSLLALGLLLVGCGYPVEEVGSGTDLRLQALAEGETFTFADVTDTACAEVGLVAAYAPDEDRTSTIGASGVSMEGQDQFTLLVAFDEEGQRLVASKVARVPYDLDDLGTTRISCVTEFHAVDGRVRYANR